MSISRHYQQSLQYELILQRIQDSYPEGATAFQLAPVDQLHIGGILASERLLKNLADLPADAAILELGSGLGGLARLAQEQTGVSFNCLDISHQLNRLNHQVSLHQRNVPAGLVTADATAIPFADQRFDLVILQHSLLNIPDSRAALAECYRVLKPGGMMLLHEVTEGPEAKQMRFPVPWARTAELSHLTSVEVLTALVLEVFSEVSADDWTDEALAWRQRQIKKEQKPGRSLLSPALILGEEFPAMGANVANNLEVGAIRVMELKARRD